MMSTMNSILGDHRLVIIGSIATAACLASAFAWYRHHVHSRPPTKWQKVGEVSHLYLYPIKSCKAFAVNDLECTLFGGKVGDLRDRMFVVVNAESEFVTGRQYPKMTQIVARIEDGRLRLSSEEEGAGSVDVSFRDLENGPQIVVRIWNAQAEGVDCGDEAAAWLSRFILDQDEGLRLLYYGARNSAKEMNPRMREVIKATKKEFREADSAFYSDAVSYHLISSASVRELNHRLVDEKVSPLNFRPNIVVRGEKLIPFEEDNWDWVRIGDVVFRFIAPCTRCLFTTVDPASCKKSEAMEPLSTLKKYRLVRDPDKREILTTPVMGVYLGARTLGSISVGDDVMLPV